MFHARIKAIGNSVLLLSLVLAGCQDKPSAKTPEWENTADLHAPLSMGSGPDETKQENAHQEQQYHEFQQPTDAWGVNRGISRTVSGGIRSPGEEVRILLRIEEPEKGKEIASRTIRYKLTERDPEGGLIRLVEEETSHIDPTVAFSSFTPKLPEQEGTYYFLTAEIMNGPVVEDTVLSPIQVPVQKLEASLKLDRAVYPADGKPVLTVSNEGPSSLFFGLDYLIERKTDGDWKPVPAGKNAAVASIGYNLKPGSHWEQTIAFKGLSAGDYRFGKTVEGVGTPIRKTLYVEFSVQ
ncbi:immunoglobulin-like domain-containing protein [Paenibacillus hodogayensis]|uniref:Immunoglobulin-like domain-containing protein n=1 Tax=Paenibacillus hodogayensis TaxID=279208 RepID=A0ABV5W7J1_9BACL